MRDSVPYYLRVLPLQWERKIGLILMVWLGAVAFMNQFKGGSGCLSDPRIRIFHRIFEEIFRLCTSHDSQRPCTGISYTGIPCYEPLLERDGEVRVVD